MIIRARAPLRLGLAGGGTDVSPYTDVFGGYVLNATIDRYAYAVLKPLDEPRVRLVATDQQREEAAHLDDIGVLDGRLALHTAVYRHMIRHHNGGRPIPLELSTFCDAPVGSGLGSSSTLVVAMIHAFTELLNLPLDDYSIARLAHHIERVECGLQGGRQDQYSATFGGFNFMEFYADERALINPLRIKEWVVCELEASLVLFYTGVSRESARIIADQSDNVQAGSSHAIEAMHGLKREAVMTKECLLRGDLQRPRRVHAPWMGEQEALRARPCPTRTSTRSTSAAIAAGALAGKVSGAGGGGFMLFFVPTERRMDVIRALRRFEGQVSNCHFTHHGTQAWRV